MIPISHAQKHASQGAICIVASISGERRALTMLLRDLGPTVTDWPSAEALLTDLADEIPSCIVAAADLPGLSGLDLLAELRSRKVPSPMILIGAHGNIRGAVEALRSGARDYFDRPVQERALYRAVSAIVHMRPGVTCVHQQNSTSKASI